ncbi:MAG: site-2 protease family protein [bacterium]
MFIIFSLIVLIVSASFHELAHGWVAYKLGDSTAKDAGRLTMNPLVHIDPVGSVLVPLLLLAAHSPFLIAAARPVPVNPYNLHDSKYGSMKVSLAGPAANFALAVVFGIIARIVPLSAGFKINLINNYFMGDTEAVLVLIHGSFAASIFVMSVIFCFINLILMVFNLVPIPPLDGSKVIMPFLPTNFQKIMYTIEPYGFFILIFMLMSGWLSFVFPIVFNLFVFLAGV